MIIALACVGVVEAEDNTVFVEVFDSYSGIYTETFANGRQFTSTVPNGSQTYDAVILNIPSDMSGTLTCDGKYVEYQSGEPIYTRGYYTLRANTSDVLSGVDTSELFTFRIMGTPARGEYCAQYKCSMLKCINSISTDEKTGMYRYTFPNYKGFLTTVEGYGAQVENATFVIPTNLGYSLKKNGQIIHINNNQQISEPGSYVMTVYGKNYGVANGYELVYQTELRFSIADTSVSNSDTQGNSYAAVIQSAIAQATNNNTNTSRPSVSEPATQATTVNNVISDSLTETYNEGAGLYKETFSSGNGFYTNVSNNGMSGGNVYIDIPANMNVVMTKDGLSATFTNKAFINEQGSYILNITDNFGSSKYSARFTFRVQKGIEAASTNFNQMENSEENSEPIISAAEAEAFAQDLAANAENISYYDVNNVFDQTKQMFVFNVGDESFYTNLPAGMFSSEGLILDIPESLNVSITKDGEDYEFSNKIAENGNYEIFVNDIEGNEVTIGYSLYDRAVNNINGFAAPKGYTITQITYEDYKGTYSRNLENETSDDDSENNDNIDEDSQSDKENTEEPTEAVAEDSEDTESTTENIEELVAESMDFINSQGEEASQRGILSTVMPIDGRYSIVLSGNNLPTLSTQILVDKTAPVVSFEGLNEKMKSTGDEVTVTCDDDDVTMTLYSKSGEEKVLSESGGSVTFKGVGQYAIVAVDKAGNSSQYEFKMVRHIGAAGVGAIVFLLVLVAGIIGFVIYNSKKFSVR